ncbi:Small acidic protein 1 [Hibiscus syriacus]|uniref:Small acidic protein 1 n=1 Tax=Hibiscus syriacus TaxID=106335 RepID=A0A6A3A3D5_HIBSY|nr:Small acidic protein 1 [Hibiscus syriacus]
MADETSSTSLYRRNYMEGIYYLSEDFANQMCRDHEEMVFKSYGWTLPPVLISLLFATGPKAFLLALALHLGQSAITLAFEKISGKARSNQEHFLCSVVFIFECSFLYSRIVQTSYLVRLSLWPQKKEQISEFVGKSLVWIAKVFKSYGWTLPPVLISLLFATGPKAFLLALALHLGQSAITLAFEKISGKARSNQEHFLCSVVFIFECSFLYSRIVQTSYLVRLSLWPQKKEQISEFVGKSLVWIAKVFKSYGWTLPPVLISLLFATGPKAFLLALALHLGQSAITLAFEKISGKARSNQEHFLCSVVFIFECSFLYSRIVQTSYLVRFSWVRMEDETSSTSLYRRNYMEGIYYLSEDFANQMCRDHEEMVFKSYGWTLPPVLISLLFATGPKAFLLALALHLGQSAITLAFEKISGKARSKQKRKARVRKAKKYASRRTVRNVKGEREEHEGSKNRKRMKKGYQSWTVNEDSLNKSDRGTSSCGGWDELDGMGSMRTLSAVENGQKRTAKVRDKLSMEQSKSNEPFLLRLLIAGLYEERRVNIRLIYGVIGYIKRYLTNLV